MCWRSAHRAAHYALDTVDTLATHEHIGHSFFTGAKHPAKIKMNTAAATDHADATANCHDYALVRTNERTGADYNIWVSVDDYTPYSPATWSDPGEEAQVEATGWGTLGNEIELTQDELDEVLLAVEEDRLGTPAPAGVVHTDLAQREQLFSGGCPHLAAVFHNMSSIPATGF